jgi:hypothetical protein
MNCRRLSPSARVATFALAGATGARSAGIATFDCLVVIGLRLSP